MSRIQTNYGSNEVRSVFLRGTKIVSAVCALALTFGLVTATASPLDGPEDGRVRASKPTVMTVKDKSDHVDVDGKPSRASVRKTKRRSIFFGPAKAWNGIVEASGKMLFVDQDVPAPRERQALQKPVKD